MCGMTLEEMGSHLSRPPEPLPKDIGKIIPPQIQDIGEILGDDLQDIRHCLQDIGRDAPARTWDGVEDDLGGGGESYLPTAGTLYLTSPWTRPGSGRPTAGQGIGGGEEMGSRNHFPATSPGNRAGRPPIRSVFVDFSVPAPTFVLGMQLSDKEGRFPSCFVSLAPQVIRGSPM